MPLQLTITGDHATDLISEVQQLAQAFEGGEKKTIVTTKAKDLPLPEGKVLADKVDPESDVKSGGIVEIQDEKPKVAPKNLTTKEQREAVKEMVDAGEKDDRYDRLNNTNQKRVDAAIEKAQSVEKEEPEQTDIEEAIAETEDSEVTIEMVREKMGELGKDKNGDNNRENLIAIRDILVQYIPEGKDIQISNIPSDELANFYESISEIG